MARCYDGCATPYVDWITDLPFRACVREHSGIPPLYIQVHLAAEDPRLLDLQRNVLSKLERIVSEIKVDFSSQSRTGMFENSAEYGEIWYDIGGRRTMSRSTTETIVLETICTLANVTPPAKTENTFTGHPLAKRPRGAALYFYALWPLLALLAWGAYWRHSIYEEDSHLSLDTSGSVKPDDRPEQETSLQPANEARKSQTISLATEKPGSEPQAFVPVVGDWSVASDEGQKVLLVDGRKWKSGQPAAGLADKARAIYGSKHEDFIDNVKAFAYFPYAVAREVDDFQNGEMSMRFKLLAGQLDQCAGILFNLKPNGDYLTVRFNDKEDNLVLWTFKGGKRSFVKRGKEDMPLPMNQWESMKVVVNWQKLEGYLNGKLLLEYDLPEPVSGKVGVWSKTDSVSEFSDFTLTKNTLTKK